MQVRLVTLNLGGYAHGWLEGRADAVKAGLRELKPDVVCLQEANLRHGDRAHHQAREVADAAGLRYVAFAPYGKCHESDGLDEGGVATLSRWPFFECRARPLPVGNPTARDERVMLVTELETPGESLAVINTHLSWRPEERGYRFSQIQLVLEEMNLCGWTQAAAHAVLCGDLNAEEDEPTIRLASERLCDSFRLCHPSDPGYTWSSHNPATQHWGMPDRRLDYIFCPKGVQVAGARLAFNQPAPVFASDHFAVCADLRWP